ncbi:hypothetical protein NMR92_001354 [Vibrio cholerae]|uniref:Uncharacterized protein n=2 Tax=Vibrio TaxID=662 RepID=A0A1B1LRE0_VIBPH|nr:MULTISPECIES: hypothetical protein [Vibrio]ANS55628.1 hypothetical protein [Vibrio parahaemolyticus]EJL6490454.1 hypothetical protein [Vibrio cholerae]EJL6642145.1 hypothetical protein [Vibrio cholerae]MBL4244939.1 hypothetical protein [Vibrio fluvialis]MBL4253815.1 hypothetical protein [Vibrio fluvialis]
MIEKIFIDTDGLIWFKNPKLSNWYDHPSASAAKRARQDNDGHPKLAGICLSGVMISEIDKELANRMADAIQDLDLPDYLVQRASNNLSRVLPDLPN